MVIGFFLKSTITSIVFDKSKKDNLHSLLKNMVPGFDTH